MQPAQTMKRVAPDWAKEASRPVFRSAARATVATRQLPDFLIIGTKRGGTTTFFKYLLRHPATLPMWPGVENAKKTHFFDQNWHRGTRWYRAHFPSDFQRRRVEREYGASRTGEAAPYYMFHPLVLHRVQATLPEVKVFVLLRNPVDRIWSHYHERVNAGTEHLSFHEAIEAEPRRLSGEVERMQRDPRYYSERHDFCSYLARGRYLEHLEPWLDAFYPHQLQVVRSEDLYTDHARVTAEAHRFLGLPEIPPATSHRFNQIPASKIDPATRAWLVDYYRPHVEALESRLGRSFGWADFT